MSSGLAGSPVTSSMWTPRGGSHVAPTRSSSPAAARWTLAGPPELAPSSARNDATSAHAAPAASGRRSTNTRARTRLSAAANAKTASWGRAVQMPRPLTTSGCSSEAAREASSGRWRTATMPAWRSAAPNSVAPRPARGVSSPSHARIARLSGSRSATAARIARPPKLTSAQSANARTTIPRTSRPRRVRNPSRAPPPKTTSGAESTAMASGSGSLRVSTSTAEIGRSNAGARSDGVSFEVALLRSQATDARGLEEARPVPNGGARGRRFRPR